MNKFVILIREKKWYIVFLHILLKIIVTIVILNHLNDYYLLRMHIYYKIIEIRIWELMRKINLNFLKIKIMFIFYKIFFIFFLMYYIIFQCHVIYNKLSSKFTL